ncbi:hypothetical protein [Rickettsiella endosymbiont of Dermanyssus gallinae]|uniref:hypothetical protein n=1 Tax=Rickettsiella endosymbiont of Dermanyssus gallinae TaxID=2856608 RepID=UPI001C52D8D9|nr:hypothetical protein [Rickettsiella endosymbiont of Dermanyssus gallinae]
MPPKKPRSLNYTSEPYQITPFETKKAAIVWLKENKLDLDGTPILLPFYNENKRIEFLNPGDDEDSLRVMGDGVIKKPKKYRLGRIARSAKETLTGRERVPHMKHQGESIAIGTNDFLIVYQKNEENASVGRKFVELYCEMYENLEKKIESSPTNDAAQINPSELVQALSKKALGLNIVAGICYFIIEDKKANPTVYRYIFKEGVRNTKMQDFLAKEKDSKLNHTKIAIPVQIENNKTIKTHRIAFIKDFLGGAVVLGTTAVAVAGAITCCMLIIPFPISLIASAAACAVLLPGLPLLYKKAIEKNKPTTVFANTFTANAVDTVDSAPHNATPTVTHSYLYSAGDSSDAIDSAPPSASEFEQITVMPHKTAPTVLVRSSFPRSHFISRLDSIDEEEDDSSSPSTSQKSSIGIRHG